MRVRVCVRVTGRVVERGRVGDCLCEIERKRARKRETVSVVTIE